MEELCEAQPESERVLHQAAQGAGPPGQGTLLDHRPRPGVHVRGRVLQAEAQGVQEEGAEGAALRAGGRAGCSLPGLVGRRRRRGALRAAPSPAGVGGGGGRGGRCSGGGG